MYALVQLIKGYQKILTYSVPETIAAHLAIGSIVTVPLQKRIEIGLIVDLQTTSNNKEGRFTIRSIIGLAASVQDQQYYTFLQRAAQLYAITPRILVRKIQGLLTKNQATIVNPTQTLDLPASSISPSLSIEQQIACEKIKNELIKKTYTPMLLHGITGSGKTIVYLQAIEYVLTQQKQVLFLVPEIGLAIHMAQVFTTYFTNAGKKIPIYQIHAAIKSKDRTDAWNFLSSHQAGIIIGIHLPTLLPTPNLGLIIVDEEHDSGYQEQRHPRLHTREIAHLKAQTGLVPIIFGSATPSIQTLQTAQERSWKIINLPIRFSGAPPIIEQVCLLEEKKRPFFWVSSRLQEEIQKRLDAKEQSLIFLNRRGFSFFIQCRDCGHIFQCPYCSVSLTLHQTTGLACHYCGYKKPEPTTCGVCQKHNLAKKGIGTQQLVQILQKLFPLARIERADLDTTKNKQAWGKTAQSIAEGAVDILVGTQTITKGYHFPSVTLVGVIWADTALAQPQYNACEKALQQLLQVAGRAGRAKSKSLVLIQYCAKHPIFSYLHEEQYLDFVTYELSFRKMLNYPPFAKVAEIEVQHTDELTVEKDVSRVKRILQQQNESFTILGPAKPIVHKKQNIHFRTLLLKTNSYTKLSNALYALQENTIQSSVTWTIQPV